MFNNDDTITVPTYDPLYDPLGTAIPFTLYDELSASRPQNQLDEESRAYDSYLFLDTPAPAPEVFAPAFIAKPEPQPPEEPEISFYPPHLPQVPLLTNEVIKATSLVHDWLDKNIGIKIKVPSFIDPEAMLQYLA
jgi:hypothetical protein